MPRRHYNGLKTAALFGAMWAVLLGLYALVGGGNRSLFVVFAAEEGLTATHGAGFY